MTVRWPVRHVGIGVIYYDSEEEARIAAGTAGELLPPSEDVTWASGPSDAFQAPRQPEPIQLKLTEGRRALLQGIDKRQVTGYPTYDSGHVDYFWRYGPGQRGEKVTAKVHEFIRAGWVPRYEPEGERRPDFKVELTEEGRKVLEASRG